MARRRHHNTDTELRDDPNPSLSPDAVRTDVRAFEDRRLYTPDGSLTHARGLLHDDARIGIYDAIQREFDAATRPVRVQVRTLSARKRRLFQRAYKRTLRSSNVLDGVRARNNNRLSFRVPNRVAICVRRKIRREVLHALKRNGGGGSRRRRFNYHSSIRC